jgi:hypothetical protein
MNEVTDIVAGPNLLEQYGCGPIPFSGEQDALYERHLRFDHVIDPVDAEHASGLRRLPDR